MTPLEQRALAIVPLPKEDVDDMYEMSTKASKSLLLKWCQQLCESHERLRLEQQGATVLLEEDEKQRQETRQLIIEMRKYVIFHGHLIGECVAWNKLKEMYKIGDEGL